MEQKVGMDLLKCAKNGNIAEFKTIIAENCSDTSWTSYYADKSGDTVLTLAARHGHVDMIKLFTEKYQMNLEQANFDGKRALHEASQAGHADCVSFLLSRGVEVDSLKRADWTPLMMACTKTNLQIIQQLLGSGAKPHLVNKDGWNSLHLACRVGDSIIINYLLDKEPELWNTVSKNGRTPLHTAALHGRVDTVKILLDRGRFGVDTPDSCGTTPFMDACRAGHALVAQTLVEQQQVAEVAEDMMGRQSMHLAAQAGCEVSVQYLLTRGISPDVQSSRSGVTPLHVAAKEGQGQMLHFLITQGADLNKKDNKGRTALHIASGSQHLECVRILLDYGAQDCPDDAGNTASSLALSEQIKEMFCS